MVLSFSCITKYESIYIAYQPFIYNKTSPSLSSPIRTPAPQHFTLDCFKFLIMRWSLLLPFLSVFCNIQQD